MKTKIYTFKDFEIEKLNKEAQKAIKGGGGEPVDPNNPVKSGGGNGNG